MGGESTYFLMNQEDEGTGLEGGEKSMYLLDQTILLFFRKEGFYAEAMSWSHHC